MNEGLLKRLSDIRTALQSLIADAIVTYGDDAECVSSLKNADSELSDAEDWVEPDEEEGDTTE